MNLHHAINYAVRHVGAIELRYACLVAIVQALIDLPRRVQRQPLRRLNLNGGIGDHPLDSLAVSDWLAEGDALFRIINRHLQQAFRRANAARAINHRPWPIHCIPSEKPYPTSPST